jgi:hypothetical protein
MIPPFDEALADLMAHYAHRDPDDLIEVLKRAIEGLEDDKKTHADGAPG